MKSMLIFHFVHISKPYSALLWLGAAAKGILVTLKKSLSVHVFVIFGELSLSSLLRPAFSKEN